MQAALKTLRLVNNDALAGSRDPVGVNREQVNTAPVTELETLFQAHHGRVFRTAQRITGSAADAEDVLQTVFLRLIKGQEDYDLSRNPEAYLSRAAINASLDLLRSRTRSKVVALDDVNADALASGFRNPELEHADQELQTLVRQAKHEAENAKISIRSARKDANDEIKKLLKEHISEDLTKGLEAEIQKMTDDYNKKVDDVLHKKEKDIMTV